MKFTSIVAPIVFALAASAIPAPDTDNAAVDAAVQAASGCGAAGSCHGFGGGDLCNDRVCSSPALEPKRTTNRIEHSARSALVRAATMLMASAADSPTS